jgi:hypothetical protein
LPEVRFRMNNKDKEFVATHIDYPNPETDTRTGTENFRYCIQKRITKQEGIADKNVDFEKEDKVENLLGKQVKSIAVFEGFLTY